VVHLHTGMFTALCACVGLLESVNSHILKEENERDRVEADQRCAGVIRLHVQRCSHASRSAIVISVRPSVCPMARSCPGYKHAGAACSLATCGLRTRPRTDVDPPRVELPSAGGHIVSSASGRHLVISRTTSSSRATLRCATIVRVL